MIRVYTDAELRDLRLLPRKVTNPGARWSEKPPRRPIHRQRIFEATGAAGDGQPCRFVIDQRQSLVHKTSYSCGILLRPPRAPRFILARYNGSNHQHGDIRYRPHIHRATEAAVIAGKKPDHYAKETTRFETLEGALACLIEDYRISGIHAEPDHPSLFNDYQS